MTDAYDPEQRAALYRLLGHLINSGIVCVDTLKEATGLRRFEVEAELAQRALAAATRAKPKRRWKPRFVRKTKTGEP